MNERIASAASSSTVTDNIVLQGRKFVDFLNFLTRTDTRILLLLFLKYLNLMYGL